MAIIMEICEEFGDQAVNKLDTRTDLSLQRPMFSEDLCRHRLLCYHRNQDAAQLVVFE